MALIIKMFLKRGEPLKWPNATLFATKEQAFMLKVTTVIINFFFCDSLGRKEPSGVRQKNISKQGLTCVVLLVHYDVIPEIRLASVVCTYGLGAVISQEMDDGQERPVAYASQTLQLSVSDSNYVQIKCRAFWQSFFGLRDSINCTDKKLSY